MKKNKVGFYIFSFIFLITFITMYLVHEDVDNMSEYVYLENGWDISGDMQYKDVDLSELVFNQVVRGETFSLSNTIPEVSLNAPTLVVYTIHSAFRIFLDDELIYEYGFDRAAIPNKLVGFGYFMIPLPENPSGKKIDIQMQVTETNAFTNISPPILCDGTLFIKNLIDEKKIPLAINMFLFVMGMIIFSVSIIFGFRNSTFYKLACIGAFSMGMSTWSMCSYDLIFAFTYNPLIKAYLEFVSLYVCTLPLIMYFWDEIHGEKKTWVTALYDFLLTTQIIFVALAFVLQVFNIVSFPQILILQHILLLILACFLIIICARDLITKAYKHVYLTIGASILLLVGVEDIVRFNLQKYVVSFQGKNFVSSVCVGTLLFVIFQIIDYYNGLQNDLIQLARTDALEKMAYVDELTGLYNRRKSEEEIDIIAAQNEACGVFSFDLNNLKTVNDSFGHEKGDELLIAFARVLTNAFKDDALVVRTGGDEFIALVKNPNEDTKKYYLTKIREQIELESEKLGYHITVAIGYSDTMDARNADIKDTLRRADQRMYKNKRAMKEK